MGDNWGRDHRYEPRDALAYLQDALIECDAGTGATVLVGGGPASGRTRSLHQLAARADELGILTVTAAGAADERQVEGGIIDQLLANPILRAAADRYTEDDPVTGLCTAVHRLARERAVLIAVDDVEHADEMSARLLLRLQRRARSAALLLVLTHAETWYDDLEGLAFAAQPHHHVRLLPLSVEAVAELVGDECPAVQGDDDLPERIHALSAGNPLLVNALLDASRGGAPTGSVTTGIAFSQAVHRLLHRYGSPLREVATAMAVLDTDVSPDAVATVAGVDPADVEVSVGLLADTGLVTGSRFRQPPAAAAVVGGLRGSEKVGLHFRAAEVKQRRGLAAADVARHLVAAGEAAADWALPVLVEAAEQVMLADDVDFATRCLDLAATAASASWERQTIAQLRAKITWRTTPAAAAPHLRTLREAGDSLDRSDRIALARQSLWFGDQPTFTAAVDRLVHDTEPLDPRTAAELGLAGHWHFGTADVLTSPVGPGLPDGTARAGTPSHPGEDPWLHTAATLAAVWHTGGAEMISSAAERILANCPLSDTSLEALATAILALSHDGRPDRAEGWCASLLEEAEYRGALTWQALLGSVSAHLMLRRGDVSAAQEHATAAFVLLDVPNWGAAIGYPLAVLVTAHTAAGAVKSAASALRTPIPDVALSTLGGIRYLRARGQFHLATNRGLAAVSDFQRCGKLLGDHALPLIAPWRTDLAEANLMLGNSTAALELARQQLTLAAPTDHATRGAALRVLAMAGESTSRPGMLNRAAESFKACGDRLELAKTLRSMSQLGPRPAGVTKQVPRTGPVRPAPAVPRAVPTRPAVPRVEAAPSSALSEAELRVAELAADGRTNRQIAEALYITVSTVEQHLTRVYRKLGVPGRAALADELTPADSAS
ncbi:helix-turn-helix transcriptional regulator [Actinokineospora enzanensis]|uniref:helix-turn-helix transcriptional regulator n=1 Tax=Actinokineospora enzanensis TaxID=155975 RepID=UPI00036BD665|nr:helix-turn-helix transcriptional regulator [Actinokineospora enzanensis]